MIIQAPPLPPLTEGAFLRAGWQPSYVNGTVPDLSGFGKNGTLATVKPAFEVDPMFGPTMRTYANESGYTFNCALGLTTVGTWGCWYKTPTLTLPAGTISMFLANGDYPICLSNSGNAYLTSTILLNGIARTLVDNTLPSRVGVFTFAVATYNDADTKIRLYVDGVLRQTSPVYAGPITNWNAGTGRVAHYNATTFSFDGNLCAPFVLNRCWSDAEVREFYNQTAKVCCWKTEGSALVSLADEGGTVGAYLSNTPWQFGDAVGRWRVETDTVNGRSTKVITCKTAGWVYLDSSVLQETLGGMAFGETEFMIRRVSAAPCGLLLFGDTVGRWDTAGQDGWSFDQWSATQWELVRSIAGVAAVRASGSGMTASEWQTIRVARTVAGTFSCYRNNELLSTAGGVGTNPITDTTTLTGRYITFYAGVGDKLALGSSDGANCFVKRPKSVI